MIPPLLMTFILGVILGAFFAFCIAEVRAIRSVKERIAEISLIDDLIKEIDASLSRMHHRIEQLQDRIDNGPTFS